MGDAKAMTNATCANWLSECSLQGVQHASWRLCRALRHVFRQVSSLTTLVRRFVGSVKDCEPGARVQGPECRVTTLVAGRCRAFSFGRSEWFAVFLNVVRRQSHRPLVRLLLSEFAQCHRVRWPRGFR